MTDTQPDPRKNFVPRFLPWLLAAAALIVYLATLNHWVSFFNLNQVARTSGWMWQPEIYNPVNFVITCPFHALPAAQIPLALNLFAAICAAITLGLLARSVAILPHDRTDAQRRREQGPFSIMTVRIAWLPPVFAVVVCALQFTFWEYATNYTGDMFSLLLFAFVIWSVLEYRLDERERRLFVAAFVYGAGMANDWAIFCFFPAFLAALIWIRGVSFFNLRFFGGMILSGLAGLLFYLVLPAIVAFSGTVPLTFGQMLQMNVSSEFSVAGAFFQNDDVRRTFWILSPSSLVPFLLMGIRWHATFGDTSRMGRLLATWLFHCVHAVFLIICIWVFFDPPFSPREKGFGLTLYYLSALCVGYYSGYFLLVFRDELGTRFQMRGPQFNLLNFLAAVVVWFLFLAAAIGLVYKNIPLIEAANNKAFRDFATLVTESLPDSGGMLLSDDSQRLYLTEAALARDRRSNNFIFLDTQSLIWPAYHKILHREHPNRFPDTIVASETNQVSPLHIFNLLGTLAKTNALYYLHPSFGYYFEQFYLEPHGLVYKLNFLPTNTWMPPVPDKDQTAANETFWAGADLHVFPPVENAVAPAETEKSLSWGEQQLKMLRVPHERNFNSILVGIYYSRGLDCWAVELQRAGELMIAADYFKTALKLNPDNPVAKINLGFNQSLQAGERVPIDLARTDLNQFGPYNSWTKVLDAGGPFDEPSFCFANGLVWVRNDLFRQAMDLFNRVCQLEPDNLTARLWLAQLSDFNHLPDQALQVIHKVRSDPARFHLDSTNELQLSTLEAAACFQKNDLAQGTRLIEDEISRNPTNETFLATAVQLFTTKGLYTNALSVLDSLLREDPTNTTWLFNRGYLDIQLKDYDKAIVALTGVLSVETNNGTARFNRAIAYLNSDQLNKAQADYEELNRIYTNSFRVYYGLGEIAWRQRDTNDAVKYYTLYLQNANTNTAEATNIIQRLRQLQGTPP